MGRIVRAIHKRHPSAYVLKIVGHPYQESGIPDLLVCVDGLFVGMEAKWVRPGESHDAAVSRATLLQRRHIQRIVAAGGMAGVVTSVEEALDLIDRAYRKAGKPTRESE